MSVDENCPVGEHLLTVFLNAEFPGGSARLKNDLLVEVYEPVPETDEKAGTGTGTGDDGDQTGSEDKNAASKTATGNGTATGEGTDAAEGTVSGNDDEMGTGVGPVTEQMIKVKQVPAEKAIKVKKPALETKRILETWRWNRYLH